MADMFVALVRLSGPVSSFFFAVGGPAPAVGQHSATSGKGIPNFGWLSNRKINQYHFLFDILSILFFRPFVRIVS